MTKLEFSNNFNSFNEIESFSTHSDLESSSIAERLFQCGFRLLDRLLLLLDLSEKEGKRVKDSESEGSGTERRAESSKERVLSVRAASSRSARS